MSAFTGFENQSKAYLEYPLDLGDIIHHPASTFIYTKTEFDRYPSLHRNDWAIVDASLYPDKGDVILLELNAEQFLIQVDSIVWNEDMLMLGVLTAIIKFHNRLSVLLDHSVGDLNKTLNPLLIPNPEATFISQAAGNNMLPLGIPNGSLNIVERHIDYKDEDIAVVYQNGAFYCRRLNFSEGTLEDGYGVSMPIQQPFSVEGIVTKTVILFRSLLQ
ncbi:hypothetical protein GLP26_18830 [Photobacterium carnosum]|uniref:LexA family protein n=1 Tax=Photobacterium carnosum TaxID=2023717 RepID=UPI001F2700A5|nr:S24 family peptidase [Photobacterium carnosum]MCF2307818.1 hypothetical protein [Photobacterium carnosum]